MMTEYSDCFVWRCDSCELEADFARGGVGSMYDAVAELRGARLADLSDGWALDALLREADCRKARAERSFDSRR